VEVASPVDNTFSLNILEFTVPGYPAVPVPYTDPTVLGLSTPPAVGDTATINNKSLGVQIDVAYGLGITATPEDPFGAYTPVVLDESALIVHPSPLSDNLTELFNSEAYRLHPTDWGGLDITTIPVQTIPAPPPHEPLYLWQNSALLNSVTPYAPPYGDGAGVPVDLEVRRGGLEWPATDYTTPARDPANPGVDYSGFPAAPPAVGVFYRVFSDGDPHSGGVLQIVGITSADLGYSYLGSGGSPTGKVNVECKVPGDPLAAPAEFPSGWLDCFKLYVPLPPGSGALPDGHGGRIGAIVDTTVGGVPAVNIQFTFGPHTTALSLKAAVFRVTFRDDAVRLEQMAITNW